MILRTDGSVKRILCILLVLSTIWGCSSYQKETAKETLAFSVLPISSSLLGLPIQIVAFDSVLLVNDYYLWQKSMTGSSWWTMPITLQVWKPS